MIILTFKHITGILNISLAEANFLDNYPFPNSLQIAPGLQTIQLLLGSDILFDKAWYFLFHNIHYSPQAGGEYIWVVTGH